MPETIRTDKGELLMRIQFPKKGKYEQADIAFDLYADGFMRGVSVGFMPMAWNDVMENDGEDGEQMVRVYTKAKLLEVSLVGDPQQRRRFSPKGAGTEPRPRGGKEAHRSSLSTRWRSVNTRSNRSMHRSASSISSASSQ